MLWRKKGKKKKKREKANFFLHEMGGGGRGGRKRERGGGGGGRGDGGGGGGRAGWSAQEADFGATEKRDRHGGFNVAPHGSRCPTLVRAAVRAAGEGRAAPSGEEAERAVAEGAEELHVLRDADVGKVVAAVLEKRPELDGEAVFEVYHAYREGEETRVRMMGAGSAAMARGTTAGGYALKNTKRLFSDAKFEAGDWLVVHVLAADAKAPVREERRHEKRGKKGEEEKKEGREAEGEGEEERRGEEASP